MSSSDWVFFTVLALLDVWCVCFAAFALHVFWEGRR